MHSEEVVSGLVCAVQLRLLWCVIFARSLSMRLLLVWRSQEH